jgi:leishmanolysin
VYYSSVVNDAELDLLKDIISKSIDWFQNVLSVKRLKSNIVLDFSFEEDYVGENYTPLDYLFNEGVEADYLMFVGVVSDQTLGWVGSATYLSQDENTRQPIVGVFDMNYYQGFSYEDLMSTAIHEMAHTLGFDDRLYQDYIKENGDRYGYQNVVKTENVDGKQLYKIITPKVLKLAREAFNCQSLDGVELETQGGEGTAFAHWEKRVMYNDYMTPDAQIDDIVYTDVSMALFEDMGWYSVNYEYTTRIFWGYRIGCSLVRKNCIENEQPTSELFCKDNLKDSCDFMRLHKARCNIGEIENIPKEFQYFSNPLLGGSDIHVDYCPVVKPIERGNCRGLEDTSTIIDSDYGEKVCENCRCVEGTYSKIREAHYHVGCHWIECEEDYTIVHIGDEEVNCDSEGGEVKVPNYNGVLYCPKWEEVCSPIPCMNACSGIGICNRGVCECPDGSQGGDCTGIMKDFSYRDDFAKYTNLEIILLVFIIF